jgi:ParB family chromosome partitioning protein
LIPAADEAGDALRMVAVDRIEPNPRQPRAAFDEGALQELARSLGQIGMLQPILVRGLDEGRYQIVAGERRHRAAQMAEMAEIPVIVRQTDDAQLLTEALVENIHRADLNALEEAAAYRQLLDDLGMTHDQLASGIGKSRSAISNALRLLTLPAILQHKLAVGSLSPGHARALLPLGDAEQQQRVAQRVIGEGLSVRATEDLVRSLTEGGDRLQELADAAVQRASSPYEELQARLTDALSTKVSITGSDRRGRVVINYSGREDLERVLTILGRGSGDDFLAED